MNYVARLFILLLIGLACTPPAGLAQTPSLPKPTAPQPADTLRIGAEEVLLDLVVRDKKGRPVTDLKQAEIEVYEDGVKQEITSFRRVNRSVTDRPAAAASAAPTEKNSTPSLDLARQINLVTFVFERLNNESRMLARQAALELLKAELGENFFASVYVLDQRLRVIQHFTSDREKLRAAVELATGTAATQFAERSESIRRELENAVRAGDSLANTTAGIAPGGPPPGIGQMAAAQKFAEMTLNTLRAEDNAEQQMQGGAAVSSLLSLISGQRQLAGRKTVLYFSEGMQVPPNLLDLFRAAISAANRANISFYTIDARGLGSAAQMDAQRDTLLQAARSSQIQQVSRGGQAVTFDQAGVFDTAESSLRRNKQGTLAELAEGTGGFLIANTNNFVKPLQRVAAELTSYYEVIYTPNIREYDGKFRTVKVKLLRPDAVVQTRSGYFALPPVEGAPLQPYEMPLLAALSTTRLPRDFEYRATALRFGQAGERTQHTLLMEVPLAGFNFLPDQQKKTYQVHFSLLALVKNAEGRVLMRFSQDYPLTGPLAQMEARKKASAIFMQHFWLPPGRYTLETVARDNETDQRSARRAALIVPTTPPNVLRLSSVVLVKRVEHISAASANDAESPLRVEGSRIVPNLNDPVERQPGGALNLYFVIYPAPADAALQLMVEILQDGAPVARATPEVKSAAKGAPIPYLASIPYENFKPGQYEARIVVRQGTQAAEEHTFFTIRQ